MDESQPAGVDVGLATAWIVGCCVTAFSLGFSAAALFELVVYDIPEAATWWDMDALVGILCAWLTLMALTAKRVRVDDEGIHRRSLWRQRTWPWHDIVRVSVERPRLPMVRAVLAYDTNAGRRETPWGINQHAGGAPRLLEAVTPLARANGVPVLAQPDEREDHLDDAVRDR